jgi:L-asparaginase II
VSEVRLTRDPLVESVHHVSYCVWQNGDVLRASGDITTPVFYRSAAKPFQALVVVESGAADRFRFTDEELAMVMGSHDGSPAHAAIARSMLGKIGVSEDLLRCGGHRPLSRDVYESYVRDGYEWGRIEDNCSGKHSGMIGAAIALGEEPAGYAAVDHAIQRANRENVALFTEFPEPAIGIDGCAVPSFAVPLESMAAAIARYTTPELCPADKQEAAARIRSVVARYPEMIAGPKRFDTVVMRATDGKLLSKEGAEGVVTIGVSDERTGIAIKVADGSQRALNAFAAALLADMGLAPSAATSRWFPKDVRTREGDPIGRFEVKW